MLSRKLLSTGLIFCGDSVLPFDLKGDVESPYFFVVKAAFCVVGTYVPATGGAWVPSGAVSKAGPKVGSAPCNPPPAGWQALGTCPRGDCVARMRAASLPHIREGHGAPQ